MIGAAGTARADFKELVGLADAVQALPLGYDYEPESALALAGRPVLAIQLHGNERTESEAILRELFLRPGDPFDPDLLGRDLSFVLGLGLFAAAGVVPYAAEGGVTLHYHLVERGTLRWGLVYPVVDYQEEGIRYGAVYRHRSLLGRRESLSLEATGGYEKRFRVAFGRPWLGKLPLDHSIDYSYVDEDRSDQLHNEAVGLTFWLALRYRRPLEHRFLFRLAWGERSFLLDEQREREAFSSVAVGYSRDTRNSFTRPSAGGRIQVTGTLFDPILGSSVYQRQISAFLARYQRLGRGWVGALATSALGRQGELFYRGVSSLGGLNSVRGYAPRAVDGWVGSDSEYGARGRHSLEAHLELRHDLLSRINFRLPVLGIVDVQGEGVLFADAGHLWDEATPFKPASATKSVYGLGGGLRLYTPVGDVLRAELGVTETGQLRVHLGSTLRY